MHTCCKTAHCGPVRLPNLCHFLGSCGTFLVPSMVQSLVCLNGSRRSAEKKSKIYLEQHGLSFESSLFYTVPAARILTVPTFIVFLIWLPRFYFFHKVERGELLSGSSIFFVSISPTYFRKKGLG